MLQFLEEACAALRITHPVFAAQEKPRVISRKRARAKPLTVASPEAAVAPPGVSKVCHVYCACPGEWRSNDKAAIARKRLFVPCPPQLDS